MGTLAMIVIVALIETGVTLFTDALWAPEKTVWTDLAEAEALEFCSNFINSYCNVLKLAWLELYKNTSNHWFHWPTATNNDTVAKTGNDNGRTILKNTVKSPAPSILADSNKLFGKPSINERITIKLKTPMIPGNM